MTEPKVKIEVVDVIPKRRRWENKPREDVNRWLAQLPPEGQALRISFETSGEVKRVGNLLRMRRRYKHLGNVGLAQRGLDIFLWKEKEGEVK